MDLNLQLQKQTCNRPILRIVETAVVVMMKVIVVVVVAEIVEGTVEENGLEEKLMQDCWTQSDGFV